MEALLEALPPGVLIHSQFVPSYEHLDFTWGIDAAGTVYAPLAALLRQWAPRRAAPPAAQS